MEEKRPDPEKAAPAEDSPPAYVEEAEVAAPPSYDDKSPSSVSAEKEALPSYDEAIVEPPSYEEPKVAPGSPLPLADGDDGIEEVVKPSAEDAKVAREKAASPDNSSKEPTPPPGAAPADPAVAMPPPGAAPAAKVEPTVPPAAPPAPSASENKAASYARARNESKSDYSPVFEQQVMHRRSRSYSQFLAYLIIAKLAEHHLNPDHQLTISDISFIMLCTRMLMNLARSERDFRSFAEVRIKMIDHIEEKLDNLVKDLKDQKITPAEYSVQLKEIKQELQIVKKDQTSMREELFATALLKKVDRMETLGKAEEQKIEKDQAKTQSKTKENEAPKAEAPRMGKGA